MPSPSKLSHDGSQQQRQQQQRPAPGPQGTPYDGMGGSRSAHASRRSLDIAAHRGRPSDLPQLDLGAAAMGNTAMLRHAFIYLWLRRAPGAFDTVVEPTSNSQTLKKSGAD